MKPPKFLVGFLIGAGIGMIIWYWQKSTSAEDGALAVLDRLAQAEARVRELEARQRAVGGDQTPVERQDILKGIGDLWGREGAANTSLSEEPDRHALPAAGPLHSPQAKEDLKVINGIGPTYERRLNEAGVHSYADLARQSSDRLREITGVEAWHSADPEQWIAAAQDLTRS